jgi:hypothetical protein
MVHLPQEIEDFVSRGDVGKVVATVSPDDFPSIGLKGSIHVYDDGSPGGSTRGTPDQRRVLPWSSGVWSHQEVRIGVT